MTRTKSENGNDQDEKGDVKPNASAAGQTEQNTPSDAPAPIAAVEPAFDPDESVWRGKPRYMCRACGYDSLNRDRVIEHIRMTHSGRPQLSSGYVSRRKG